MLERLLRGQRERQDRPERPKWPANRMEALIGWFAYARTWLARVGLEVGTLSQWLYAAMKQAGLAVELLETRHVYEAFKSMPVKSDRNDARKIAQLMRLGWFRPVHCKSITAQEIRAMLTARKLCRASFWTSKTACAGFLRGFGLQVGKNDANKLYRTHRRTGEGASEPSGRSRRRCFGREPFCLQSSTALRSAYAHCRAS